MMEFKLSKKFSADSPTSEKYADVLIHVAEKKTVKRFKAHKMILAQHSPYFDRIFEFSENIPLVHICFSATHPANVENAMKLMYGNPIEIPEKYSKKFGEFLAMLELKYSKETVKKKEANQPNEKDQSFERVEVRAYPEHLSSSSVFDVGDERSTSSQPPKRKKSPSPEISNPKKIKKDAISHKDTTPELKKHGHEIPGNKGSMEKGDHVEDGSKWTETTEDRLEDIDFEVDVTNDKRKVYKCCHCEETRIELAAAEKHFILKHQDCGNAPEVLEKAIKNYKTSQNNFEDIKKQIKNSCNLDLAKNKLM